MDEQVKHELKTFLDAAEDWKQMDTSIPGVIIHKVPATKKWPGRIMIELNPMTENKAYQKRKGIFISNYNMLMAFMELINDERIADLMKTIDNLNPQPKEKDIPKLEL